MDITIEKAQPADAAALLAFLRRVGGESDNLTFGAEGLPVSAKAEAEYLAQLANTPDGVMLLAKCGGEIIGEATLNRLPRRMRHRGDFSIAVAKAYWGKGIGSRLLAHILAFARENGFSIIDLQVRCDNLGAIHLYEKYGFQRLCTYPAFFKIGERYIDFIYMCRRL